MGSAKIATALPELMRQNVLDRLREKGISTTQDGTSIEKLSFKDLKFELVMASFREKNIDSSENSWF